MNPTAEREERTSAAAGEPACHPADPLATVLLSRPPQNDRGNEEQPAEEAELAGSRIGPYPVAGELGRGSQGVVYRAYDPLRRRPVALKRQAGPGGHFAREVELAARLAHPGIVAVYDLGEDAGRLYYTMELIAGPTLEQRLARRGPLRPRRAAALVLALCRAVAHAHARGVVHRDLKPANVLLDARGRPHLADFGLARPLDAAAPDATEVGAVLGTPAYMSPEQAAGYGHLAGPAVDIWALGAILYECLSGTPPFRGTTAQDVLCQVAEADPVPLRRPGGRVPPALEAVCLRCLRKAPDQRYRTADALAAELARFLRRSRRTVRRSLPTAA